MNGLAVRVDSLLQAFERIARTRMADLPLANPRLAVATVGFRIDEDGEFALGALVTPWCLNLLRLPLHDRLAVLAVGATGARDVGTRRFDFIGAHEPDVGAFESCSLFSPMFEFADQAAAVATAQAALKELRAAAPTPPQAARRSFLFGRSRGSAGPPQVSSTPVGGGPGAARPWGRS